VEYCSRQDLRFAGASVAVGAGRVGAVVLGVDDSVIGLDSESEVEDVAEAAARLPVSWDTRTPIATEARMMKSRASPHYLLALITWRDNPGLTRHIILFRLIACSFCFFSLHASLTLTLLFPSTSPAFQLTLTPTRGLFPFPFAAVGLDLSDPTDSSLSLEFVHDGDLLYGVPTTPLIAGEGVERDDPEAEPDEIVLCLFSSSEIDRELGTGRVIVSDRPTFRAGKRVISFSSGCLCRPEAVGAFLKTSFARSINVLLLASFLEPSKSVVDR